MNELRHAVRSLVRRPGFSLTVILTLALGIGGSTAMFSVVHGVLLRPLPFHEPDRLYRMDQVLKAEAGTLVETGHPSLVGWQEEAEAVEGIGAYATTAGRSVLEVDGAASLVHGGLVTGGFFRVLGARPLVGRVFAPEDDVVGAPRLAVLGEAVWRERFGGDPGVVGRTVRLGGDPAEVIGVVPAGFEYPLGVEVWSLVSPSVPPDLLETAGFLNPVVRVAEGVSMSRVRAEMDRVIDEVTNAGQPDNTHTRARFTPIRETVVGEAETPLWILLGASVLLLVIACANVTSLQIVRAVARRRELAVRAALGAGRVRLAGRSLAESGVLAGFGAALGAACTSWGVPLLLSFSPVTLFRDDAVGVSAPVIAFALAAAAVTTLVLGIVPLVENLRNRRLSSALRGTGSRGATAGAATQRLLAGIVVGQVAVALVLLLGAGLLSRSYARLAGQDPGFDRDGVLTMDVPVQGEAYPDGDAVNAFFRELIEAVEALPRVERAAGVLLRPLEGPVGFDYPFTIEGRPPEEQARYPFLNYEAVTPGYFEAVGIDLRRGRLLDPGDEADAPPVAVVSQSVADRFWPEGSPVGRRIKWGPPQSEAPWITVVGVVEDARYRRFQSVSLDVYVPNVQSPWTLQHLVVATDGDPAALVGPVRRAMQSLDPELDPLRVATTGELVSRSLAEPRFRTFLLGVFAAMALALGVVGVYGVVAYTVTLRAREMAVRLAVGATPGRLLALTLRRGGTLGLMGLLPGLLVGVLVGRLLEGLLFQVTALDPVTFALAPLLILAAVVVACLGPAWRASRVAPREVLATE